MRVCVCTSTSLYKIEMKSGARFMEQLLGFHVVSPDLRSRLPQPLFISSSFCFSRAAVCWRDSGGQLSPVRGRTRLYLLRTLANRTARFNQGCFAERSPFSSILMKWNYSFSVFLAPATPSNCSSVGMPRYRKNTGSPLKYAGFSMSKPVNVFLAKARA